MGIVTARMMMMMMAEIHGENCSDMDDAVQRISLGLALSASVHWLLMS